MAPLQPKAIEDVDAARDAHQPGGEQADEPHLGRAEHDGGRTDPPEYAHHRLQRAKISQRCRVADQLHRHQLDPVVEAGDLHPLVGADDEQHVLALLRQEVELSDEEGARRRRDRDAVDHGAGLARATRRATTGAPAVHRAGTPFTTTSGGTSFTTQALPPTTEPRPTVSPLRITPATPMTTSFSIAQSPEIEANGLTLT